LIEETIVETEPNTPAPQLTYTVSELTLILDESLRSHPIFGKSVVVQGELSNVKYSSRGHVYFTLKDEGAGISGILWSSVVNRLAFDLKDGLDVFLTGRLEIYRQNGTYSIVGSRMDPVGLGPLQLAFMQIRERLEAEGLFLDDFKKHIPAFPRRIGIITSSTGAVIHDMLRVIRRKNPLVHVLIHPVNVQGEGAALSIAAAVLELNHAAYALDTLIVARGGGSFEDLFCFSEECVVRAIFQSDIPVVTGIGHEPDFSLADAVADYSASTPTAAADWVVPDILAVQEAVLQDAWQLHERMVGQLNAWEQTLDQRVSQLITLQTLRLDSLHMQTAQLKERFTLYHAQSMQTLEQTLQRLASELDALSPLKTLGRGYAVVHNADQDVIQSVSQVKAGEMISIRVADGGILTRVQQILKGQAAMLKPAATQSAPNHSN